MTKKLFLNLLLVLIFNISVFSQSFMIQARPVGSKEWGYINIKGDYVIQPQYTKCSPFSKSGYASILNEKKKRWDFIDINGVPINVELDKYDILQVFGFGAKGFYDGLAAVRVKKRWGFINTQGKVSVPPRYDKVQAFSEGHAIVKIDEDFLIVDIDGNEKTLKAFDVIDIKHFSEGLAPFKTKEGLYGFLNPNGDVIIPAQFLAVGYFKNGLAWAKTADLSIGYINKDGSWAIQPQYLQVKNFDPVSGLARVKLGEMWQYITTNGTVKNFNGITIFDDFVEGIARAKSGASIGFINSEGEWIANPIYDGARDFHNGYAAVKIVDKWGIIDTKGNLVVEPKFAALKDVEIIP